MGCNFKTRFEKRMARHNVRAHMGAKPFKCTYCPKTFESLHHMNCHMRIHTGEKPYKCNVCHKQFSQKMHMARHMTIHQTENSNKVMYSIRISTVEEI